MNSSLLAFFQLETIGLAVAAVLLLASVAAMYIAFRVVKRTAKMAFKMTLAVAVFLLAAAAAVAFWYFSDAGDDARPRPSANRRR